MSDDNKVVPFPSHKVKKSQNGTGSTSDQPIAKSHRGSLVISLFSTVLIATIITSQLNNRQEASLTSQGRGLASQDDNLRRELQEDILLAKQIARASMRQPASRGREPTAEDILRHGELAGLYSLSFGENGALTGLVYEGKDSPRFVEDRAAFIKRNADLLRIDFESTQLMNSIPYEDKMLEVYNLIHDGEVKAKVHFTVDPVDRFYSMKVENI